MEPLEIGAQTACLRGGQPQPCEVIERRPAAGTGVGARGEWDYYVHYVGINRRLDEWVTADRIVLNQAGGSGAHDGGELGGRRATRKMKRRIDDMNALQAGAAHDEEMEKEHEESTKIKNIQSIEMGRFEVDTWYFSPFPDDFAQQRKLYICEFTLKYMKKRKTYLQHCERERARQPPGRLIYKMEPVALHRDRCAYTHIYIYINNKCLSQK